VTIVSGRKLMTLNRKEGEIPGQDDTHGIVIQSSAIVQQK
jgi:hypothetical protein